MSGGHRFWGGVGARLTTSVSHEESPQARRMVMFYEHQGMFLQPSRAVKLKMAPHLRITAVDLPDGRGSTIGVPGSDVSCVYKIGQHTGHLRRHEGDMVITRYDDIIGRSCRFGPGGE